MWFSPLKGAHLTLGQLDKTLPVDKGVEANMNIERGSFVYIKADDNGTAISPRFALYTATEAAKPNAVPYIALMGVLDFQAGMAGNVGQAEQADGIENDPAEFGGLEDGVLKTANANFLDKQYTEGRQAFTGPRITAISVVQPAEYQTTAFDKTKAYYVSQPLTIANGKLTPWTDGNNIVGYVTATPKIRWINDLGASHEGARISGGNASVLEFSTAWIPVAAVAGDADANPAVEGNVGKLDVGAPKVAAAAQAAPKAPAAPAAQTGAKAPAAPAK